MAKSKTIVEQAREHYEPGVPYQIPVATESLYFLLETAATLYPNVLAIDYFGQTFTYKHLLDQTKRAAQVLLDAGVKRGDVVAIVLPNCPQAFVAFYACQRIGAIAAQHNPLAPSRELAGQFQRHRGKVAIAWEKSVEALPLGGVTGLERVFSVDLSAHMPVQKRFLLHLPVNAARKQKEALRSSVPTSVLSWDRHVRESEQITPVYPQAKVDDTAVILHTGGTNGIPKSVPLTHRNIGTNVQQCMFWVFELHPAAETFYSLLPYFHAFGLTFFLCAAVKKAATQIVLPKFDVDLALEAQRRRPVTFFVGVPPMFERIAQGALASGTDITSIRFGVAGAMPLTEKVAHLWESVSGGKIIEGYGLSETSPVISGSPLSDNRRLGTLGLPFPSTEVRLVDLEDTSKDVKDGEPGEIIVRGPQVFAGYLDAPEENAHAFTEDGWFRTGDIAISDSGYLYLADRRRELILSGGFNVYPSQVESVIREIPGVKDVAVVGVPGVDKDEVVTAALLMEEGAPELTIEQIREWSMEKLSNYALPKKIEFIDEMPRNQLGKVLRRAVRDQLVEPASKAWETASQKVTDIASDVGEAVMDAFPSPKRVEDGDDVINKGSSTGDRT